MRLEHNIQREGLKAGQFIRIIPEMVNVYVDISAWNNVMLFEEL